EAAVANHAQPTINATTSVSLDRAWSWASWARDRSRGVRMTALQCRPVAGHRGLRGDASHSHDIAVRWARPEPRFAGRQTVLDEFRTRARWPARPIGGSG